MTEKALTKDNILGNIVKHFQYNLTEGQAINSFFEISSLSSTIDKYQDILLRGLHYHNFYTILWFFSGEGSHIVDTKEYKIEQDNIFFLSPQNIHSCCNWENIEGIMLSFSENFLLKMDYSLQAEIRNRLFQPHGDASNCKIPISARDKIMTIVRMMQEASSSYLGNAPLQTIYLVSLLSMFLIDTIRMGKWNDEAKTEYYSQSYHIYLRFFQEVEKNFTKYHAVKDYIKILNVSRTALNLCTNQYAQMTPLDFINKRIILEAKRMILYGNKNIQEICLHLGLDDCSYFTKFFKRYAGVTPSEYKSMKQLDDDLTV